MKTLLNKTECVTSYENAANGKTVTGHAWYAEFTLSNGKTVDTWFPISWTKKRVAQWLWEMYGVEVA